MVELEYLSPRSDQCLPPSVECPVSDRPATRDFVRSGDGYMAPLSSLHAAAVRDLCLTGSSAGDAVPWSDVGLMDAVKEGDSIMTLRLMVSLLALFLASCTQRSQRVMDTPAARLVGHWITEESDDLYFAASNADGLGNFAHVHRNGTDRYQYKIVRQIPQVDRVIVQMLFPNGNKAIATCVIPKDGKILERTTEIYDMKTTTILRYVDGRQEP